MVINYGIFTRLKTILLTSIFSVLVINIIVYLSPENQGWWNSSHFTWINLLQFLLIDQILIECVSVLITFFLLTKYAQAFNLSDYPASKKSIIRYQVAFLPVALLAFFAFNPVTLTLRFFYHYLPDLDWSEYFYSTDLYLTYLPIVFIQVYTVLNINLTSQYSNEITLKDPDEERSLLEIRTENGVRFIAADHIIYGKKDKRKTIVATAEGKHFTNLSISELEETLPKNDFIRINRATIVQLAVIDQYAYWENDKYVLTIKNGEQFIVSRQRLKSIKTVLKPSQK